MMSKTFRKIALLLLLFIGVTLHYQLLLLFK